MSKPLEAGSRHLAHAELVAEYGAVAVGTFVEHIQEDDHTTTYLFEVNLKGYLGWRWSVTIFQLSKREAATISEVLMVPGPNSLVAPDWIPWSERLADWKALQTELERQAAEEAAEAEEAEGEEAEEAAEAEEAEEAGEVTETTETTEQESASASDVPEGIEAEGDSGDAGPDNPRGRGRRRWFGRKKNN